MSTTHQNPNPRRAQAMADLSPEERRLLKRSTEQIGRSPANPLDLNVEPLEDRVTPAYNGPTELLW